MPSEEVPEQEVPSLMSINKIVVPFASVLTLMVAFFSGYLYLENKFDEAGIERQLIRDKITQNSNSDRREFDRLDNELSRLGRDRIFRAEIELWSERLKSRNPGIDVPPIPKTDN